MKVFRFVMPGLGLLLLGYLIGKVGLDEMLRHFAVLKWYFPLVLGLACSWHITNSIAWSFAFLPGGFRPRLRTLFMAKLAGEAINQLTPLANIGGEPLKAYLLKSELPTSRGLASVVVNKTAQIITGLIFTTIGLSLIILHWDLPHPIPLPIQIGLVTLLLIGALLIYLLYRKQKHLFSSLLNLLRKVGIKTEKLESKIARAMNIDANIGRFYREHKTRFILVLCFHCLGWLLGAFETFVILRALGADIDFSVAFLITSLSVIINGLFFFMPSNIGVLEGGQVFLFITLGLSPVMGLSLGMAKRMRKIFWIFVGWLFLTHLSRGVLQREILTTSPAASSSDSDQMLQDRLEYR